MNFMGSHQYAMPVGEIMREIFIFLLLPLKVRMLLGRLLNKRAAQSFSKWAVRASLIVLAVPMISNLRNLKKEEKLRASGNANVKA